MINRSHILGAACLAGFGFGLLPSSVDAAGLTGTSVTGSIKFGTNPTNYFDPANGFVPSGYLNTAGTTVSIAAPATEFGFNDNVNLDTANFSATQFTLEDVVEAGPFDSAWTMTFTDPAFAGQSFTKVSDSFPFGGLSYTFTGTTLTVSWAGGTVTVGDDYTSTFTVKAVPEPSTWAAMGVGAGALALAARRRRLAA